MDRVTLKDIAREMNMSVSTISRAMNNAFDINKETRERILKKAKEMGYHPNPIAQRLHNQKSHQVGVVVPELYNDFFPQIIKGIQDVLQEKDYQLLIMQSDESYQIELDNVKKLENNMVDGLLISLSSESINIDYYNELFGRGMPMVFFNRTNESIKAPKVVFNDFKWAYFAVEHLIQQGCKKIYHFAGFKHLSLSRERIRGYEKAMNKFHLEYDNHFIFEIGFSRNKGEEVMSELIEKGDVPDAIFAANDPVAFGAIKAIKKAGLKIPEDIAVVGFTEGHWSDLIEPPLTSVKQPAEKMGREAALLLMQQIEEKSASQLIIELDGILNVRESSCYDKV